MDNITVGHSWKHPKGTKTIVRIDNGRAYINDSNLTGLFIIQIHEIESEIRRDLANIAFREKQLEIESRIVEEQQAKMSLRGFEGTLSPRMRARAVKCLCQSQVISDGIVFESLRDLIENKISQGYRVTQGKDRRLQNISGEFLDSRQLTKIGMDYAQFIQNSNLVNASDLRTQQQGRFN